jgi:hypothetical protein
MTANALVLTLESTSALVLFALLVFWLIPNYRVDSFRQQVFAVRDDLFDYARSGKIDFGHPAYRLLRQSANGFLRYAHRLTFYRVVVTSVIWKTVGHTPELVWTKRWTDALASLDEQTRSDLLRFHDRLTTLIIKRLIFGSPFLIVLLLLSVIMLLCKAGITSLHDALKESARGAVASVVDTRLLEEDAAKTAA